MSAPPSIIQNGNELQGVEAVRGWLVDMLRPIYEPPPVPEIGDWLLSQDIEITADQNPTFAGQAFDHRRFPVVSKLVFKFFQTPDVPELFVIKPVQSTFTTHVFFALCHRFLFRPCTAILVMHTRQEVRKKKKDTYAPTFARIPELANSTRVDGSETTAEEFRFEHANLYVGGGQSASVLTSTAANVVILDEAEQHSTVGDTTTINLARGRITAGDKWRKLVAFSKPEEEAQFQRDDRTGKMTFQAAQGTYLHAEYLSGNQLRYECPCPHCGVWTEPKFEHLRWEQCNLALPGLEPQYDRQRIVRETFWQCPSCQGRVHEGDEKRRWVHAGEWRETPGASRERKDIYPTAAPGRWSAQFSAFTDIAFDSLKWGNLVNRWLDAQGDPVKLRAFWNEIMGRPMPLTKSGSTEMNHLRRLIPGPESRDPLPYRIFGDAGEKLYQIPLLSTQVSYLGMTADNQKATVKYRVRAYGHDGRSYLLDFGEFPATPGFPDLRAYLQNQMFTTLDGHSSSIYRCYMDGQGVPGRWHDCLDLALLEDRVRILAGSRPNVMAKDRVWPTTTNSKSGNPVSVTYFEHNYWAGKLYADTIQRFDPKRHNKWAPAIYFPVDMPDSYFHELMQEKEVWRGGRRFWEKVSESAVNDYGDCEKMGLVMDWLLRGCHEPADYRLGTAPEPEPEAAA